MMERIAAIVCLLTFLVVPAGAQIQIDENNVCVIYFTGIGCPHCAKTDPIVLGELPVEYGGRFVVIEYEVYKNPMNARIMKDYHEKYGIGAGIPNLVVNEGLAMRGDKSILKDIEPVIDSNKWNDCLLLDASVAFGELNLNELPGKPNIWVGDRILIKSGSGDTPDDVLKEILLSEDIKEIVKGIADVVEARAVPLSGSSVRFDKAADLGNWIIEWNEEGEDSSIVVNDRVTDRWVYYYLEWGAKILIGLAIIASLLLLAHSIRISRRDDKKSGG